MSRRHAFSNALVLALLLVQAAAAGAAWFARHAADRQLVSAAARADSARAQLAAMPSTPAVETAPAPTRWRLPETNDVAATMQQLQLFADTAGIVVEGLKPLPSTVPGKQTFAVTLVGAPTRVVAFVVALEEHERLLVVESARVGAGGAEQIVADVTVAAWHRGGGR